MKHTFFDYLLCSVLNNCGNFYLQATSEPSPIDDLINIDKYFPNSIFILNYEHLSFNSYFIVYYTCMSVCILASGKFFVSVDIEL